MLKPVGGMSCLATQADESGRDLITTKLDCELQLFREGRRYRVIGRMQGPGLYLVEPTGVQVFWRVLAPTANLDPKSVSGDYDITSRFGFE